MEGRSLSKGLLIATVVLSYLASGCAAFSTFLTPRTQAVPHGERFNMKCRSMVTRDNGSEYRHELYAVTSGGERLEVRPPVATPYMSTNASANSLIMTTEFILTAASGETAGKYGCLLLSKNGSLPVTFSQRVIRKEVTVEVCSEPKLRIEVNGSGPMVVNGVESCGYHGELTWLVNGHRVRRAPEASESSPVAQREDDRLEILGTSARRCQDGEGGELVTGTCSITAVLKYISVNRRLVKFKETVEVQDCCVPGYAWKEDSNSADIDFSSYSESESRITHTPHASDPRSPMDAEKWELEKEVLGLQKDVLGLKKEALPLQIRFLRRLSKDWAAARDSQVAADV